MFIVSAAIKEIQQQFLLNIWQRNFPAAIQNLNDIFQNIPFHPSCIFYFLGGGISRRDRLTLTNLYKRIYPASPIGYLMQVSDAYNDAQLEKMRLGWQELCAKADKGFHFQPSINPAIFEAEAGTKHTAVAGLGMGDKLSSAINRLSKPEALQESTPAQPQADKGDATVCLVSTEPGELIGVDGVALNGSLGGFTMPTVYYFRYGTVSGELTHKTTVRAMPAGLFGKVQDAATNLYQRIWVNAASVIFSEMDTSHDGAVPGERKTQIPAFAMKLEWPFGKDRNHLDGIGVIDLVFGWTTPAQWRGIIDGAGDSTGYPTPEYPGEAIDLRDAVFGVTYRSHDLEPKDFIPVVWIHGRTGTALYPESYDDLSAWAVTDIEDPKSFNCDGTWRHLEFDLPGRSSQWTYCGSNTGEMGDEMKRYAYAPIQTIQRENMSGNICLAFVHGNELDTPEGAIEIAELSLTYRSRSLLGPRQQAVLQNMPRHQLGNPAYLTDGTIGNIERCWCCAVSKDGPTDLVWRLRDRADIHSFKIHQSVLTPAQELEIALSDDGVTFSDVWSGELDDVPEDPRAWGSTAGKGSFARVVVLPSVTQARYIRLRVLSGYREHAAGLDAFEVFGHGLPFIPSPEPFTFSESVTGLPPGETFFAQLVAENADGVFEGEVVKISRPATEKPHVLSARVVLWQEDKAVISVRAIAMGSPATLTVSLLSDQGVEIAASPVSIGKWQVPCDVRVTVAGLKNGAAYSGICLAENAEGRSLPFNFICNENGES